MGNHMNLQMRDDKLYTPEELLIQQGMSPKDWDVIRITTAQSGDNYQQWVKFQRAHLEPNWPIVQGVKVNKPSIKAKTQNEYYRTVIVVPDMHVGYRRQNDGTLQPLHDEGACDLVAHIIREYQPDDVVMLGDNLDLAEWSSKYLITPDLARTTQASLEYLAGWISSWRDYTVDAYYLEGNHEKRLRDAIATNLRAACDLHVVGEPVADPVLSIPNLLQLDTLDVKWIGDYPRGEHWINSNLCATHAQALSAQPGQTAGRSLDGLSYSVIFGHAHRLECAHQTVWRNRKPYVYAAYCMGTLAHIDGRVPSNTARENWQQGFGFVELYDNDRFHVTQVPIHNGVSYFDGVRHG